ncbi:MAG: tyrosine--tRNA ligase [Myxococcota bacterium]|nr:tyrosine--tRNA ligase [Myxococcota bacterium]
MGAYEVLRDRGFIQQCTDGVRELLDGDPTSFYVGFDPTADCLHVGHLLPIMAMAHLQRAGHRPIAVIGGGTAMVGDPSGKDEARQLLTAEQIEKNKAAQKAILLRFLDFGENGAVMVDNAEWLLGLNYIDFLREIGRHFSMNTMLSKASVKLRLERGLSFLEFNYQVLQAYDFLELHKRYGCRLQLGGDDQWGNILAGIDLIRRMEGGVAEGMTSPLLTTASGQKMGKTVSGAVWIDSQRLSAYDYFQFWVNVDDADVGRLLRLFTFLELSEVEALEALQGADIRQAKERLALEATAIVHGQQEAEKARDGARAAFGGGGDQAEMPQHNSVFPVSLIQLLDESGLCSSRSDARRQIRGGAVRVGGEKVSDENFELTQAQLDADGAVIVARGKKKKLRVCQA